MKDHHKKASELISLEMKERDTARARGREIGGHLLTFLRVGSIKGLTPVICFSLCVLTCGLGAGMLSASAGWNHTFECNLSVFYKRQVLERGRRVWYKYKLVGSHTNMGGQYQNMKKLDRY